MGGVHTLIYPKSNSMRRELKIGPSAYCNTQELITQSDSKHTNSDNSLEPHIPAVLDME